MRKYAFLAFLIALPCFAGDKKPKPLPMPPATSHNEPISKYACMFTEQPTAAANEYTLWMVEAYAEYGPSHKRYWSKTLGSFRGTIAVTSHNAETAGGGTPIGLIHEEDSIPDAQKKCAEWKMAVHQMLQDSAKK